MNGAGAETWFRFVRHHQVPEYIALGWVATGSLTGCHHGAWSEILKWTGDGEPPEPQTQAGE